MSRNYFITVTVVTEYDQLGGPLAQHGLSSDYGWRKRPPDMEISDEYIP
jgi:hypothetical protein